MLNPRTPPKNLPEFITPKQFARLARTHVSTVLRWILHGKIPARRRAGRFFYVSREDALRFLEGAPVVASVKIEWPPREAADTTPPAA